VAGQYRSPLTEQIEMQHDLNRFTRRVESALEKSWETSVSKPEGVVSMG